MDANYWIEKLNLQPHPEGGYFREAHRSAESYGAQHLPKRYNGDRSFGTSIYFMLKEEDFSAFHRIKSDEIWHFYHGSPVIVYELSADGLCETMVGADPKLGCTLQHVIKAGNWFAAEVVDKSSYSLVGCDVFPGFDFDDFELAKRNSLISGFPDHRELITKFTID